MVIVGDCKKIYKTINTVKIVMSLIFLSPHRCNQSSCLGLIGGLSATMEILIGF